MLTARINKNNSLPLLFLLFGLMLPSFAINWNVDVYQWQNVNKTVPYINEFMVCYLEDTEFEHFHYDTYQSGVAEIVLVDSENAGIPHDLKCCDNCYITDEVLTFAQNSLKYTLELNMTFNNSIDLHYYVGDISDYLRIGSMISTNLDSLEGNTDFLVGLGLLLAFVIFIPVMLMMAFPSADLNKMISMGGSIGWVMGLGFGYAFNLFNLGQSIVMFIFTLALLFIIGGMNKNG